MRVFLTTGALTLPRAELRAVFAHSLAHLQLGHSAMTGRRVSTRTGRGSSATFDQRHLYTAEEETEADRYAARLLNTVAPGGPGCPAPPTRAIAVRGFCAEKKR